MMAKQEPLTFEYLLDWLEGRLSKEETAVTARRVAAASPEVQATVAWLRQFLQASQNVILDTPPETVRHNLQERFEQYAQSRRPPTLWQRLTAALTFDSQQQMALSGARQVSWQTTPRQLVYSSEAAEIALSVLPGMAEGLWTIGGQIFPTGEEIEPDIFAIQLLRDDREFDLTTADDLGEFTFTAVPAGVYDLILSSEKGEILISPLAVK